MNEFKYLPTTGAFVSLNVLQVESLLRKGTPLTKEREILKDTLSSFLTF